MLTGPALGNILTKQSWSCLHLCTSSVIYPLNPKNVFWTLQLIFNVKFNGLIQNPVNLPSNVRNFLYLESITSRLSLHLTTLIWSMYSPAYKQSLFVRITICRYLYKSNTTIPCSLVTVVLWGQWHWGNYWIK